MDFYDFIRYILIVILIIFTTLTFSVMTFSFVKDFSGQPGYMQQKIDKIDNACKTLTYKYCFKECEKYFNFDYCSNYIQNKFIFDEDIIKYSGSMK